MNMFDLWRMVAVGSVAIAIWEALDLLSPRLKVGLTAGFLASNQPPLQSVGIIVVLHVIRNAIRNWIYKNFEINERMASRPTDNDHIAGA
jgi:hypothetical protein